MLEALSRRLAAFLTSERHVHSTSPPARLQLLEQTLRPGDVLLVEGNSRVSTAIKYLTQSTWSHAALYVGDRASLPPGSPRPHALIEADVVTGVRATGLANYASYHCRICRPVGLTHEDEDNLIGYAIGRIGHKYDTKNVVDLMRYLLPTPPVPTAWRRKMIAFGSGDPTRAICSTLIAQAFQSIKYPVLPLVDMIPAATKDCLACTEEIMRVRHHSLFVPRDFDVSPYFRIIKPSLEDTFDHRLLKWIDGTDGLETGIRRAAAWSNKGKQGMTEHQRSLETVKHYYEEGLKSATDLQTSACCAEHTPAPHVVAARVPTR